MPTRQAPPLILASQSPRRKQILGAVIRDFKVKPSRAPELPAPTFIKDAADARRIVRTIAEAKGYQVWGEADDHAVVVSADTLVFLGRRVLGKPKSPAEARKMLRSLSGKEHHVFTAVSVFSGKRRGSIVIRTGVRFRDLSAELIDWYVKTGEPLDKAGAYGAQDRGSLLIESFRGSYTNVVGLPLPETLALIEKVSGLSWSTWA